MFIGGNQFGCVDTLDAIISNSIYIPEQLANNLRIQQTCLGGVILEYYSNISKDTKLNSNVAFKFYFETGSMLGMYDNNNVILRVVNLKNIREPHCVNISRPYHKILNKVNKWIEENKGYLINSIEH